jgi:hypothetical protein
MSTTTTRTEGAATREDVFQRIAIQYLKEGLGSCRSLAREFGVSSQTVLRISRSVRILEALGQPVPETWKETKTALKLVGHSATEFRIPPELHRSNALRH